MMWFFNQDMQYAERRVREMMVAYGQEIRELPDYKLTKQLQSTLKLRYNLIHEELNETVKAWNREDIDEFVDGLCDSLVVILGTNLALGIGSNNQVTEGLKEMMLVGHKLFDTTPAQNVINIMSTYTPPIRDTLQGIESRIDGLDEVIDCRDTIEDFVPEDSDLTSEQLDEAQELIKRGSMMESLIIHNEITILCDTFYAMFQAIDEVSPELNLFENFNRIMDSNMDKFASTQEEVDESIAYYKTQGVETYAEEFLLSGEKVWRIVRESDGKILKRSGWVPHQIKVQRSTWT